VPQELATRQLRFATFLDVLAFFLLAYDSLYGTFASIMFDFGKPWDVLNAVVFTIALPICFLAFWSRKATVLLLWCLFFLRWAVECFDGKPPTWVNPITWPWGWSLLAGTVVLQVGLFLRRPMKQAK
jgi:hypothetical protein